MMVNFLDTKTLLDASVEENLYDNLVAQLTKDFGLANIAIDIPFKVSPKNLKTILHQKVYRLMMERFSEYLNLLYIIDVPEKKVKEIKVEDVVKIADEVSFLILKREFQKVWFRNKYAI
ncbi:hypothetical protein H0I23_16480 [Cellulophaga sp. HaHaR_3_176]|uniref:hypothetical protein n=1 Tax=Cellulophaga sp. HaHaR_3_176 TaxID=1942464 RepID=UPI001C1F1F89|nr:hypothetical protein [Cellulophaga sp. HaHaR_3_176]QWX84021.1 hypothetical protein H0I23_16480 [Cellulophaga sp. HaHaR_3_176]